MIKQTAAGATCFARNRSTLVSSLLRRIKQLPGFLRSGQVEEADQGA